MNFSFSKNGSRQGIIEALQTAKSSNEKDDQTVFDRYKQQVIEDINALPEKCVGVRVSLVVSISDNQRQCNATVTGDPNMALSAAEKGAKT